MFENALFDIENINKPKRAVFFLISSLIHLLIIFLIVFYSSIVHEDSKMYGNKKNDNIAYSKDRNEEAKGNVEKKQKENSYNKTVNYEFNNTIQNIKRDNNSNACDSLNDFIKIRINKVNTFNKTGVIFLKGKVNYQISDNREYFKYELKVKAESNGNINEIKIIKGNPIIKEIVLKKLKSMKIKFITKETSRKTITFDILVDVGINSDFYILIKYIHEFIVSRIRFLIKLMFFFNLDL